MTLIFIPEMSIEVALNSLPTPETITGSFSMKKEQSLPRIVAYSSKTAVARLRLYIWFNIFKVKAPSAEPPPNPAPIGMILCR